jgi:hypothetical protein
MENIELNQNKTINWYTIIDDTIKESSLAYYTDVYTPWQTKQQLEIWKEVLPASIYEWFIDTSDSYTTINNSYSFTISSVNKIISIWIDWVNKTFNITSYSSFLTNLQNWLWVNYTVTNPSWWNYVILRNDWRSITKTSPNLVRKVSLSSFDTISIIDLIIDWTTISLNWATHSWNSWTAFTYLITQLPWWVHYAMVEWADLIIARIDWAIPVITETLYNKYTYDYLFYDWDTPNSWQGWLYSDVTIDWTTYRTNWTEARPFEWLWLVAWLMWEQTTYWSSLPTTEAWNTSAFWPLVTMLTSWSIKSITKDSNSTATRWIIKNSSWTIVATATFSWNVATFSSPYAVTAWNQYYFQADSNGSTYTRAYTTSSSTVPWANFVFPWNVSNITAVTMNVSSPTTWYTKSNSWLHFYINKNDYTTITWSILNHYNGGYWDDSNFLSITTTNHQATSTTATYTEITITLTNSWWNYYYIPAYLRNIKKITFEAVWNNWNSSWEWTRESQSCIARYSSNTYNVSDKIFKTDASNYWNIVSVWIWYFILEHSTTVSNKINYICT